MKNTIESKQQRIIDAAKQYIVDKLGKERIWEWLVAERYKWNGGHKELKLRTWPVVKNELSVLVFLKTCWGIGHTRNGSLAWKFTYRDEEIERLLENESFIDGLERHVLEYAH
ncbi:MAG: hypothetical protein EBR88_07495 [Betaproteobacteria bacterium]|nr:hypothetical protein [Betaproteobacteria bacterium]